MNEDLVQAAKAAKELEPAVEAFAEATGSLEPVREATGWVTDLIRYKRLPHQAKLLMKAAEKVKASGLPTSAVSDKLLRAVLEDGPLEDDEDMQERWANLLANAVTAQSGSTRIAFPKILSELEPGEAAALDEFAQRLTDRNCLEKVHSLNKSGPGDYLSEFGNLNRLGLIHYVRTFTTSWDESSDVDAKITGARFTQLGWDFVKACQVPASDSS